MLARLSCSLTDGPGQRTLANRVEGDIAPARATELIAWLFTWHHQSDMHGSAFVHASRGELVVCRFFPDPLVDGRSEQCAVDALVFDEQALLNTFIAPTDALAFLEKAPLAATLPPALKHAPSARERASVLAAQVDEVSLAALLAALSRADSPSLKHFDVDAVELCMLLVPRTVRSALTFSVQSSSGAPTPKPAVVFRPNSEGSPEAPGAWARAAAAALIAYADGDELPTPATTGTPFEALIHVAAQTMAYSDRPFGEVIAAMLALPSLPRDAATRFVSKRALEADTMAATRSLAMLSATSPATTASQIARDALISVLTEITRDAPRAVVDDLAGMMRQSSTAGDQWVDVILEHIERLSPTTAALVALQLPATAAKKATKSATRSGHAHHLRGEAGPLAPETIRWLFRDALGTDAVHQLHAPILSTLAGALAEKLGKAADDAQFVGQFVGETLVAEAPRMRKGLDGIATALRGRDGASYSALERVIVLAELVVSGSPLSPDALGQNLPQTTGELNALVALLDVLRTKESIGRVAIPVAQLYDAVTPAQRERLAAPLLAALAASIESGNPRLPPVLQALVSSPDALDGALLRMLVLERAGSTDERRRAARRALSAMGKSEFELDTARKREFEVAMALGNAILGDAKESRVRKQPSRTSLIGRIWGWWRLHRWL